MTITCALAFAGTANAIVIPEIVSADLSDRTLGGHPDLTLEMKLKYGGSASLGEPPFEYDDPGTYSEPSDSRESVKNLVVETPTGFVGNPNAVPFAERCDEATFMTSICPASSTIGDFEIEVTLVGNSLAESVDLPAGRNYVHLYIPGDGGETSVSLLKTDPEVPAKIGIRVDPPFGFATIRQVMEIKPDTNGDLRLQTTTPDGIANQLFAGPTHTTPGSFMSWFRVDWMWIKFHGMLANGNSFLTNSTSCQPWNTSIYARAYRFNQNVDSDPLGEGFASYKAGNTKTVIPDCTNEASIPFPATGTVAISSNQRDVSPDFDFTIDNPGVQANGQVSTSPKKIVTRVPASINVDVQQLSRTCAEDLFAADVCPASTRVGSVKIETPLLRAGLSGDVYLVRKPTAGLPDLGLRVRGAITFTQRGSNKYVGVRGNEIETTFDNIPQIGFSKLTFHLDGGTNGLLRTLACPTDNKQPAPGDFSYAFTSWTGASSTSTTKLNSTNCFGVQKLRSFKCVYRVLRFQPTYTSRARIKRAVLYVDGRRISMAKRVPFGFKVPANRFKKGWHKLEVRATYDDGTVSKKRSKFKRC